MATIIDSAQVVQDFGAYYINEGQNEGQLHDRIREDFGTMDAFTVIETEDTVLREVNVNYLEALQSFQTTFTPKGGITFVPKAINLFNVKVDQLFYPDALKNQWLAFMTSNNLDRTTWPFVRWFIEHYVFGQIKHDIETKAIFGGVYTAPTPGVANAASQTMNGIKKIINDAITAGLITPIVTGAPNATPATFAAQIESFTKAIPELYWERPMALNTSRALARRYKEGRRSKYNMNYAQVNDLLQVEDAENIVVTPRASHGGSNKIWATPKQNAILAFKGGNNRNIVEVEKVDRQVKVYTDFWIGIGFIDDSIVFTNDQDLAIVP